MRILFIGDIVGRPGRTIVKNNLSRIIKEENIDFIVANGENSAGGLGITKETYEELIIAGIDVVTLGNHTWDKKEVFEFINKSEKLIRPANYPEGNLGKGYVIVKKNDKNIAVVNINGRVYMDPVDCPFRTMDKVLKEIEGQADIIIVDFHGEASSEKQAMGWYLDGRVTAVVGTHTHVQTADERLLHNGTAYITDVGMTGPMDSILGMNKEIIVNKFIDLLPARFEVAKENVKIGAVIIETNSENKAITIKRLVSL